MLDSISYRPALGSSIRHHRVAVENAASETEVAAVLNRFISESIQVNPTKITPASANPAPENQAAA